MAPSVEQLVHSNFSSAQSLRMKPKHVQHELTLVHGYPSSDSPTLLQHLHCTGMLTRTMHDRVGDTTSLKKCTGLEGNVQTHAAGYNTSNNVVSTRNVAQLHRNSSNEHRPSWLWAGCPTEHLPSTTWLSHGSLPRQTPSYRMTRVSPPTPDTSHGHTPGARAMSTHVCYVDTCLP